jgi:hypothetical protein
MGSRSETQSRKEMPFERGQRLYCPQCQSEIEITEPCPAEAPNQVFRCCGQDMKPSTGVSVNVNVAESMD